MAEPAASRSCSDHAVHRSLAGRRSRPTCAQSAQGKARKITEKQARLFYRNFPGFSDARELAGRYSSNWRKQVWFLPLASSPAEVQEENPPGAEVWRPRRPPTFPICQFLFFVQHSNQVSVLNAKLAEIASSRPQAGSPAKSFCTAFVERPPKAD